jgi:hypothetical protein
LSKSPSRSLMSPLRGSCAFGSSSPEVGTLEAVLSQDDLPPASLSRSSLFCTSLLFMACSKATRVPIEGFRMTARRRTGHVKRRVGIRSSNHYVAKAGLRDALSALERAVANSCGRKPQSRQRQHTESVNPVKLMYAAQTCASNSVRGANSCFPAGFAPGPESRIIRRVTLSRRKPMVPIAQTYTSSHSRDIGRK